MTHPHDSLGKVPAEPSTHHYASRTLYKAAFARTFPVPTPTRHRRQNRPHTATTAGRSDLITVRRTSSPELVMGRGRVLRIARVGQLTKMHASAWLALPRCCAGCVSSPRAMAKPRTGMLDDRADSSHLRLSVKDEAGEIPTPFALPPVEGTAS